MKINDELLNLLTEKISCIINEELGISSEISNESNKLEKYILEDLKNAYKSNIGLITYKENSFKYTIFGVSVNIFYKVYTSGINAIKNKLIGQIDYSLDSIDLYFNLGLFNGCPINAYFGDIIYHELTHLYQYIKSKKKHY